MKSLINRIFSAEFPGQNRLSTIMLVYRIMIAFATIRTHGLKKIDNIDAEIANIPDPLGLGGEVTAFIAIFTNLVLTTFVALGFATRISALGILSVTLSGLFLVHFNDPWPVKDVPLMYSLAYLIIFMIGPGKYSIDELISNQSKNQTSARSLKVSRQS